MSCSQQESNFSISANTRSNFNLDVSLQKEDNTTILIPAKTVSTTRINNGPMLVILNINTPDEMVYQVNAVTISQQNDLMKVKVFTGNNVSEFNQKSRCTIQKHSNNQLAISINYSAISYIDSAIVDEDDGF